MPLLLLDLDNTLLPRDAAFRAWAQDFLAERGLPPAELDWLTTIDGGGYVPRSTVLSAARRRYGLDHSVEFLLAHYRRGINSYISCPTRHIDALRAARLAGWTLGIVSNGGTRPQLEKIRRTGLGPLVDGWVISEEADCIKPDPLIFEIAARRCGVAPTGDWATHTWMIGDHAPADIAGAELTGLRSVWLHHGRPWSEPGYRPTLSAPGLPEAVGLVLTALNAPCPHPGTVSRPRSEAGAAAAGARLPRSAGSPPETDLAATVTATAPGATTPGATGPTGTNPTTTSPAAAASAATGPAAPTAPGATTATSPKGRARTRFATPASSLAPRPAPAPPSAPASTSGPTSASASRRAPAPAPASALATTATTSAATSTFHNRGGDGRGDACTCDPTLRPGGTVRHGYLAPGAAG